MATANHVLLQRTTLTADTASVTLNSIPQTGYTDLKLVVSARGTNSSQYIKVAFNGDTTAGNYGQRQISGNGTSPSSGSFARLIFEVNRSSYTANTFANCEAYIPNYNGSQYKSYSADSVNETNGATAYMTMCSGIWNNTAAITSVNFTIDTGDLFVAGSSFAIYGVANAVTTPATAPKADGGDIIKTDGTYWYHAFLSTGSFKPQLNLTADVLVVAGGGGGSGNISGGGGAGGLLGFTSQALASTTTYACTVGAGGATGAANDAGTNGGNSQFGSLTAAIGGGAGRAEYSNALSGGSGGGARDISQTSGSGTAGQGNAGGPTLAVNVYVAMGGGGAAAAGSGTSASNGAGAGGSGATFNSTVGGSAGPYSFINAMGSATGTGQLVSSNYYYAGGGGGGGYQMNTAYKGANGGAGGGGNGGYAGAADVQATAGTPNTGGGGGGGRISGSGGAGGSGIIIIRYPV